MKDIDLAVCAIGPHDVLLDWLLDLDLLDQFVQGWQRVLPFLRRDDLDDSGSHAVRVYLRHLPYMSVSVQTQEGQCEKSAFIQIV